MFKTNDVVLAMICVGDVVKLAIYKGIANTFPTRGNCERLQKASIKAGEHYIQLMNATDTLTAAEKADQIERMKNLMIEMGK